MGTGGQRSEGPESVSRPPGSSWWKPHKPTFLMQREQVMTERSEELDTALRGRIRGMGEGEDEPRTFPKITVFIKGAGFGKGHGFTASAEGQTVIGFAAQCAEKDVEPPQMSLI